MIKNRIVLVQPMAKFHGSDASSVPPYALLYVGSALERAGYKVDLYHGSDKSELHRVIGNPEDIIFVGFSAFTGEPVVDAAAMSAELRVVYDGLFLVLGGYHASTMPRQSLLTGVFDVVVEGEGEETVIDLAFFLSGKNRGDDLDDLQSYQGLWFRDSDGGVITTGRRKYSNNIDFDIDWDLVDLDRYVHTVGHLGGKKYFYLFTSRGCPYNCSYCSAAYLYERRYRKETVEHVIQTYKWVIDKYKVDLVEYLDDNFFVDLEWAEKVASGIDRPYRALIRADRIDEGVCDLLNRTNCRALFIGIESGNDRVRNEIMEKGITSDQIRNAVKMMEERCPQINVTTMFIMGIPGETYEEYRDTARFAIELTELHPRLLTQANVYVPYPRCKSYLDAIRLGWNEPKRISDWIMDSKPGSEIRPVWLDWYGGGTMMHLTLTGIMFMLLRRDDGFSGIKKHAKAFLRMMARFRLKTGIYAFAIEMHMFWLVYKLWVKKDRR